MGLTTRLLFAFVAMAMVLSATLPDAPSTYVALEEVSHFISSLATYSGGKIGPIRSIGLSIDQRPIQLVEAGAVGDFNMPAMLLIGLHHGREPMGLLSNMAFLRDVLSSYLAGNAEAAALMRFRRFIIIPVMNPDTYKWNIDHLNDRMARKNRRQACTRTGSSDIGVDLNRNYPFEWDRDNEGSSPSVCADDYRGPGPFSEPESQAVRDFLGSTKAAAVTAPGANVTVALNWHSFGRLVNLPFAVKGRPQPPAEVYGPLLSLARSMAGAMGFRYAHPWEGGLYTCNGEASDWMVDVHGILAYSPELGPDYEDSFNDAQFKAGMWPGPTLVPGLVGEALKGAYVAAWASGSNLGLDTAAVAHVSGSGVGATGECSIPGMSRTAEPCDHLTLSLAQLSNAGSRAAHGAVRVTAVPARSMDAGPVCVQAGAGTGTGEVCVHSLQAALDAALVSSVAGTPTCVTDDVLTVLPAHAAGIPGRGLQTGAGTDSGKGRPVPVLSSMVLQRVREALIAKATGRADTRNDTTLLTVHPRRQGPGRVDLSVLLESSLAQEREGAIRAQRRELAEVSAAMAHPLGAAVWTAHGPTSLPAWSMLNLTAAADAAVLSMVTAGSGGCWMDGKGAAAYVSISDEQTCAIYRVACEAAGITLPVPVLAYRGPAGCMPCAAFRHLGEARVGNGAPTVSPSAAPTPTTALPSSNGTSNESAWQETDIRAGTHITLDAGKAGAWPWMIDSGVTAGSQLMLLVAGVSAGALAGLLAVRRWQWSGRGRYVPVREGGGGREEDEDEGGDVEAQAQQTPATDRGDQPAGVPQDDDA